jgi:flagellar biosynthesis anti-sigma factor FlgM
MKAMKKNDSSNLRRSLNKKTKNLKSNNPKKKVANLGSGKEKFTENDDFLDQNELFQAVKKAPAIDPERVAKIKRELENGEYKTDVTRTAEKLLRLEDEIWSDNSKP